MIEDLDKLAKQLGEQAEELDRVRGTSAVLKQALDSIRTAKGRIEMEINDRKNR